MVKKILRLLIFILLMISCISTPDYNLKKRSTFNPAKGYLIVSIDSGQVLTLWLKYLDGKGGELLKIEPSKEYQIIELKPGDYAIYKIEAAESSFLSGKKQYALNIPLPLMCILEIRAGEALFLGNFKLNPGFFANTGSYEYDYRFEEALAATVAHRQFNKSLILRRIPM